MWPPALVLSKELGCGARFPICNGHCCKTARDRSPYRISAHFDLCSRVDKLYALIRRLRRIFFFFANSRPHFLGQFGCEFIHAVGRTSVFSALLENFLLGFAAGNEIAVNTYISATNEF